MEHCHLLEKVCWSAIKNPIFLQQTGYSLIQLSYLIGYPEIQVLYLIDSLKAGSKCQMPVAPKPVERETALMS